MNINKMIFKYCIEIMALIFVIFITYPVWQVLGVSKGSEVADYYDSYNFDYVSLYVDKYAILENIYPVSDADVDKSNYTSLNIVNNSKSDGSYRLVMVVEKNSTLSTSGIKIELDGSVMFLEDLYLSENDYVKYYVLDEGTIDSLSIKNKKVYLWLDESIGNEEQNKLLTYNYQVL